MTSRERILAALRHEPVDRVPIDFGGHRSSGIMALAYARLKDYLGIRSGNIYIYDLPQQLAIVEPAVLDELSIDVIEMGRGFMTDDHKWKDWVLSDGTFCKIPDYIRVEERVGDWYLLANDGRDLAVRKRGNPFMEQIHFPMADRNIENESFDDLEEQLNFTLWTGAATPDTCFPLDEAGQKKLTDGARTLRHSTERGIVGLFGGSIFEIPQALFGMENFLSIMGQHPEAAQRLFEKMGEIHLKRLEKWLKAVGQYIDVIQFIDDLGSQTGPLISVNMFRKFLLPLYRRFWKYVKENSDIKIMLHSCGAIEPFIEDLINAGADAINPVQISSAGMEPALLKTRYGKRICLWGGGYDTRKILPQSTPIEVASQVRQQVSIMQKGSGFIFQPPHNILPDMPPENIVAMFHAVNT